MFARSSSRFASSFVRSMSTVTFRGNPVHTVGALPKVGETAPEFKLVNGSLAEVSLDDFKGKKKVLNIFPSCDTKTCSLSVKRFNTEAAKLDNAAVLCVSADLPFAQGRFCQAENATSVVPLSTFRSSFGKDYGVTFTDGPLAGLLSRAVVVVDENNKVVYTEQVAETADEPNYAKALEALKQ